MFNEAVLGCLTMNVWALAPVPPALVTATGPEVAPAGTFAEICVAELTVKFAAGTPPKLTMVAPVKLAPVMTTVVPTLPVPG
jgi:hypothetical protein